MPATMSSNKGNQSIFNFGSVLNRITDIGFDAVEKVAPVWLDQQLNINERIPVNNQPTFQNTDPQRQPGAGLTTNEDSIQKQTQPVIAINQSSILVVGLVALGVLFFLRDNG